MGEERRKFDRVPGVFRAQCRRRRVSWEAWHDVLSINLSAGGIRFTVRELYEASDTLELTVELPGRPAPVTVHGQVAWSQAKDFGIMEYGIEFTDATIDQQIDIDALVQFLKRHA